jgi:predicted PhzF superfamily epimerase YddE/YHI9
MTPAVEKLMQIHPSGDYTKGIILTVKASAKNGFVDSSGQPYDFASRYFAPWYGVKEDPATGKNLLGHDISEI